MRVFQARLAILRKSCLVVQRDTSIVDEELDAISLRRANVLRKLYNLFFYADVGDQPRSKVSGSW